jgi:hypothetical protein
MRSPNGSRTVSTRDVYLDLQATPTPMGKFFVQDTRANGLLHPTVGAVDIVYQDGVRTIAFNDDPLPQGLTDAESHAQFRIADDRYTHMLRVLIDALQAHRGLPIRLNPNCITQHRSVVIHLRKVSGSKFLVDARQEDPLAADSRTCGRSRGPVELSRRHPVPRKNRCRNAQCTAIGRGIRWHPNRTVYHVVPNSSGEQWLVTQEDGSFRQEFRTKDEAVNFAKDRARGHEPSQ